jgi:phosphoribosyl 1,2-cyclic phosphodiesterase
MEVKLWGVRGSLPTPMTFEQVRNKILRILTNLPDAICQDPTQLRHYFETISAEQMMVLGGNTACIEIKADNKILILDMGSGIKNLGKALMRATSPKTHLDLHILISHTHWDHIMGFPFFTPAYLPSVTINFYHCHPNLRERLEMQQDYRFFPVGLDQMASRKNFIQLEHHGEFPLGNIVIKNTPLNHPGGSFAYRIEYEGKSVVYATDSEFKKVDSQSIQHFLQFFQKADLLIFDAQYSFEEAIHKEDWGHSSALIAAEMALRAGVKHLILFHHDPDRTDEEIEEMLERALDYRNLSYPDSKLKIELAIEGSVIKL